MSVSGELGLLDSIMGRHDMVVGEKCPFFVMEKKTWMSDVRFEDTCKSHLSLKKMISLKCERDAIKSPK